MTSQDRKTTRSFGRAGAIAFGLFLAASLTLAISAKDSPHRRRQALRESQMRMMDEFAQAYGSTDWSIVGAAVAEHPLAPENPRIMSIFISLGNVYLNRYELRHSPADLDRALTLFESVAGAEDLWGGRPFAGSVVVYLGVSLLRIDSECDVGAYGGRIEDLRRLVVEAAAAEADAVAPAEEYTEQFLETTPEEDAARAALYATAAALLPDDPRSAEWARYAGALAARLSSGDSGSAESSLVLSQAELVYEWSGSDVPRAFGRFAGTGALAVPFRKSVSNGVGIEKAAPVFEPDGSVETAAQDSRVTAALLTIYLRQFPAGSQCDATDGEEF